ncbi:MAG TPA: aldo/keto reductase [Anaerolineales bacterium]|jgi:diketogulonate reductase-like aldo/keto reductase
MRYEIIHGLKIPKIGFGTWGIGGRDSAEPANDPAWLAALRSALELGYTHFDTAEYYAAGHAEELLGQAVREGRVAREELFITTKVSPEHLTYSNVLRCCENSLRRLKMDHVDLYLIHWPMQGMDLPESFRALNQLVREGRVKHVGVSNFNLKLLKQAQALCDTALLTNQVPYSLPERAYVENGVLAYCQANNILVTAYSPVKRRNISSNPAVLAIARSRSVTPQQVALAWLAMQARVITIPKSASREHQAENIAAADLVLTSSEMEQLG